jgi:ABC-type sugar transport system substrate-binding protein
MNTALHRVYEEYGATLDGVELVFTNAGGSIPQQLVDLENLITQRVDAIVLRAVQGDAVSTAVAQINVAGIPLIIDEVAVPTGGYQARIVGDTTTIGILQGGYLQNLYDRGEINAINIGYIAGSASAFALIRHRAVLDGAPSARFVAGGSEGFVLAEGWNPVAAQEIVAGWISSGLINQMNVIIAMNDVLANGVIAALGGNYPNMIIIGSDGSTIGQHNIRNGSMRASPYVDFNLSARSVLNTAVSLARGQPVVFDDPANRLIDPRHFTLMTIDNIDQLIR